MAAIGPAGVELTFLFSKAEGLAQFKCKTQGSFQCQWSSLECYFPFAVWLIWKQHNQVVFNHKSPNPNISRLIKMQATEFFLCINRPNCNHQMITKLIRWERPEAGWLKLNTDGPCDDLLGNAGGGGLIRDEQGQWVAGYTRKIRKTTASWQKLGLSEMVLCFAIY